MPRLDNPIVAVTLIGLAMAFIPLNDAGIALLDQGGIGGDMDPMPILQIITGRAGVGLLVLTIIPGAIAAVLNLSFTTWVKLMARGSILVGSMLTYFLGLTVFQLWEMTAIFFVCPVIISLLSVPLLGERLGLWRGFAVLVGFAGVIVILIPKINGGMTNLGWPLLFPLGSAFFYAAYQIVTRMMRDDASALTMSVVQILAYFCFGLIFGLLLWLLPISFEEDTPSAFLLRDWIVPDWRHWVLMGLCAAIVLFLSFAAANAYRVAEATFVAPFEYAAVPFAIFWGGMIWGNWPDWYGYVGTAMIIGAGLLILVRESQKEVDVVTSTPLSSSSAFSVSAVDEREPIWFGPDDRLV